MCREGRMGKLVRRRRVTNNWMQQKRENGTVWKKKSVPCPKGKLLKLGIGALKADRLWITELLSHRIWENHTELPVNPVIVKSVGILEGFQPLLKKFGACCIDRAAVWYRLYTCISCLLICLPLLPLVLHSTSPLLVVMADEMDQRPKSCQSRCFLMFPVSGSGCRLNLSLWSSERQEPHCVQHYYLQFCGAIKTMGSLVPEMGH